VTAYSTLDSFVAQSSTYKITQNTLSQNTLKQYAEHIMTLHFLR